MQNMPKNGKIILNGPKIIEEFIKRSENRFKELLNNFANINPKKIVYFRSFAPTSHTIEAPYIAPEKLKILGNVFVYKEDLKTVVLLSNLQH